MPLKEFRRNLFNRAKTTGGTWHKADFHIHAPTSSDYESKGSDAFQKLGTALDDGRYSFAVILQHEEFPSRTILEELQKYCPQTTLIPGAEINVLVDTLFKKVSKDHFFHCILAVDPRQSGDYGFVLRKAQETFAYRPGDYPAGFRSSILDLGRYFLDNGALFIPAHLHQAKGPENSRSIDDLYDDDSFLGFVRDGAFTALEVRQTKTAGFFDGQHKTNEGLQIPRGICVQSSASVASQNRPWVAT